MASPPPLYSSDGKVYLYTRQHYLTIRSKLKVTLDKGDVVGIKLPKEPCYFLCMLACMELGVPYVPLKEDFPDNRIQEIKEDSDIKLIIDSAYFAAALMNETPTLSTEEKQWPITDDEPLYIIFTSGSTGRPKGVVISRAAFIAFSDWFSNYAADINQTDRVLQVTEFTFDISLIDIILYLEKKISLYFSGYNGAIFKLVQEISFHRITTINTVPNNLNMMLNDFIVSKADFSSLTDLIIGGARFNHGLYKKVCRIFSCKNITNFYGPTEFTIYSHSKKIKFDSLIDCIDNNVSIGIANTSVHSEIYNDGSFCSAGKSGELLLSGKQFMSEYINDAARTSEATIVIDGVAYYRTGDLAFKNEKDEFFITGRFDDTIKYRGYRINLQDVDSYIGRLPYVQDVTTISVADDVRENLTVSYIIPSIDSLQELTQSQVKTDLKEFLVDYQIPEKIKFIDVLPTNSNGKVCKKQLLQKYYDSTRRSGNGA